MPIVRRVSPVLEYSNTNVALGDTTTSLDFGANPPTGGVVAGDEQFIWLATYVLRPTGTLIGPATSFTDEWATVDTISDNSTGGGGAQIRSGALYHRTADGTGDDLPTIVINSNSSGSGNDWHARAVMWTYRGGELTFFSQGAHTVNDPTDAATTAVPNNTVVISAAWSRNQGGPAPTLFADNGFTRFANGAPSGSDLEPHTLAVADRQVPVAATIDLPQWDWGAPVSNYRALWVTYTVVPPLLAPRLVQGLRLGNTGTGLFTSRGTR